MICTHLAVETGTKIWGEVGIIRRTMIYGNEMIVTDNHAI